MSLSTNCEERIQKYLDELSEEYKELLFKALLEKSESIDDISVVELLRLDSEIKKPLVEKDKKQEKTRKMLNLIGLIYFYIAIIMIIIYFIFYSDIFTSSKGMLLLISIMLGVCGFSVISLSKFTSSFKSYSSDYKHFIKEGNIKLISFEVIAKWRELEGIVNDLSEKNDILLSHSVIDFLVMNKYINEMEKDVIKKLLIIRNIIVHESKFNYTSKEIRLLLSQTEEIIKKLRKIL